MDSVPSVSGHHPLLHQNGIPTTFRLFSNRNSVEALVPKESGSHIKDLCPA